MSRPPPLCRVRAGRSSSRIKQSIPRRVGWRGALCRHTGLRRRTFTPYEQSISRRVGWRGALCRNTGLRRRTSTPYKRSIPRLVGWLGALCRHTGPRRRTMTPYKLRRPGQSWRLRSLGSRHWRFVRQSRNLGRRSRLNRRTGCFTRCFLKTLGRRGPTPLRHDGRVEGTKWVLGQTAPHHAILSTAIHRRRENAIFSSPNVPLNVGSFFFPLAQFGTKPTSECVQGPPDPTRRMRTRAMSSGSATSSARHGSVCMNASLHAKAGVATMTKHGRRR